MSIPGLSSSHLIAIGVALGVLVLIAIYLIAIYIHFAQEVARRRRIEIVLRQQTDRERFVTQIAQQIRQSLKLDDVLVTTVEGVQRFLQADRVLIYRLWDDGTGSAIHETVLPVYPSILGQTFPEEVFPQEYHQAYSLGKTLSIADVEQADIETCLADFVKQFGVQARANAHVSS